jgi:hypothetical protein
MQQMRAAEVFVVQPVVPFGSSEREIAASAAPARRRNAAAESDAPTPHMRRTVALTDAPAGRQATVKQAKDAERSPTGVGDRSCSAKYNSPKG